jgi:transcriptional regulator GlxA family with amidase domain
MRSPETGSLHFYAGNKATNNACSVRDFTAKDRRIQRGLELLRQCHPVQLEDIARSLHLSTSRLRHLFKKELGMSPRHCLKLFRLEQGKELLENSFLSVKEITAVVGVNDVSHFVRDYKRFYKQTPSQTRAGSGRVTPHRVRR